MTKADPEKLISFIVSSIVEQKDQFSLKKTENQDLIEFEIRVAKPDIGKIVGKGGTTIWAIRKLASLAAVNLGKKILITLSE